MFSLYAEPKTIYREFVQNAYDSIEEAVETGVLPSTKDGIVYVNIDKANRCIVIEDNGIGVSAEIAEVNLKSIGKSSKKPVNRAGFMGIGRLVGGGYCKELSFETSAKGEGFVSKLIFDLTQIDTLVEDDSVDLSANEVIDKCTIFESRETDEVDKHYFKVTLKNVLPQYVDSLLNEEIIKKYLLQVAPIPFNMMFKRIIKKSIKEHPEYESYFNNLGHIRLNVNKCKQSVNPVFPD